MVLLAAPLAIFAQEKGKFNITGKIEGFRETKRIYLGYSKDGKNIIDSCPVRNNTYHFTGTIDEVHIGIVADTPLNGGPLYPDNACEIVMTPETFTITHIDSFSNGVGTGSKLNAEFSAQRQTIHRMMAPFLLQYYSAKAAGNLALVDTIEKRMDSVYEVAREHIYGNYVRQHPRSPLALTMLERYAGAVIDPDKLLPLFESLNETAKTSGEGKAFKARIEAVNKTAIGKEAIDFTQSDTAGRPVKLSSFRGKYVLLDFWASWCHPCREENPNVVKAYAKYHPKGLDILSVSLDKEGDKDKWLKAIHDDKLTWTHVSDLKFWSNEVAKTYGIMGIPQNYLIDPQGKIVAKNLRGEELEKKLQELLP